MDIRSHILRFRRRRSQANRSLPTGLIGLLVALIVSIVLAGVLISSVYRYAEITEDLPPPELLDRYLDPVTGTLLEPTRIYDRTGTQVLWEFENPRVENRSYVRITDGEILFFQDVSESFIEAILTTMDPDYFNKPTNLLGGIWYTGLDPIPYQLVSELLLWKEANHPYRDIRINLLADQVVASYGREKVLELYLNSIYFGNQIYGIEQASQVYFGKSAAELNLEESALLAGVASFPSLNPYDSPEAAKENQISILAIMEEKGLITQIELERASKRDLIYLDPEDAADASTPSFVDYILQESETFISREQLIRGGYEIISTLDSSIQSELICTSSLMISRVYGENPELDPACGAARLLPKYTGSLLDEGKQLEVGIVYLDPLAGEILGMSGLSGEHKVQQIDTPKHLGSLITPFIYLDQFTQGFAPASLVWDIPLNDVSLSQEELHPGCTGSCDYQGPVNIRKAMINDYLSPAIQLWDLQGSSQIENIMALFGFSLEGEKCFDCELFPGSPQSDITDVAQGYGVFVNQGFLRGRGSSTSSLDVQPASILSIKDLSGRWNMEEGSLIENKVISEQLVYLVNNVLSDVNSRMNGEEYQIGRTAAVKTGYVPDADSAWVVGYTPKAVTAVWVGHSEGLNQESVDYVKIGAAVWRAITQYTSREDENLNWEIPPRIVTMDVCYPSGMLINTNCPREVREVFIEGNEPQTEDSLYQVLEINRETGLLASVFTPVNLIEENVYIDIPPQALAWAESTGLEVPPTLYDLNTSTSDEAGLNIIQPQNLSFIRGKVSIIGSIPDEEFESAKLQFGPGINPESWLQIGSVITSPGDNLRLGTWNTAELEDSVYALQLVLIKENQRIYKTSRIVSVDNTPPLMEIRTNFSDEFINYSNGKELLFIAEFENPSEVKQVDFYLNNTLLGSRTTAPYLHPWEMRLGDYQLTIKAVDQAGNQTENKVEFKVRIE